MAGIMSHILHQEDRRQSPDPQTVRRTGHGEVVGLVAETERMSGGVFPMRHRPQKPAAGEPRNP